MIGGDHDPTDHNSLAFDLNLLQSPFRLLLDHSIKL